MNLRSMWNGNVMRVREARKAFERNPNLDTFTRLVSALYTFRVFPWYARELRQLILSDTSVRFQHEILGTLSVDFEEQVRLADRCDVLCAANGWVSRSLREREPIELRAITLYVHGDHYARSFHRDPMHAHTWCLLKLHYVRILIARGELGDARRHLWKVIELLYNRSAVGIPDQRVRVYAFLGVVLLEIGERDRGNEYLAKAMRVRHAGILTRLKRRGVYLGFGRSF